MKKQFRYEFQLMLIWDSRESKSCHMQYLLVVTHMIYYNDLNEIVNCYAVLRIREQLSPFSTSINPCYG